MEINVSAETGRVPVTIIRPTGNLDSATSVIFKEKAEELIQKGTHFILVDFTNVPYISSAALRALQATHIQLLKFHPDENPSDKETREGSKKSPYLKLLNLCPNVRSVFKICGFDLFFEDFTDVGKAVASF